MKGNTFSGPSGEKANLRSRASFLRQSRVPASISFGDAFTQNFSFGSFEGLQKRFVSPVQKKKNGMLSVPHAAEWAEIKLRSSITRLSHLHLKACVECPPPHPHPTPTPTASKILTQPEKRSRLMTLLHGLQVCK